MFTLGRTKDAAFAWIVARRAAFQIFAGLEVGGREVSWLGRGNGNDAGGCQCGEEGDGELHGGISLERSRQLRV